MTSDAQINPYFHVEDKVEDALEARLTIWHIACDSQSPVPCTIYGGT